MVAIWRGKETCSFSHRGEFIPLSVVPPFDSSYVDGSSANGEAFMSQTFCFPGRFDPS
jgi:hypothetical protein